jgi:hypothetical protein
MSVADLLTVFRARGVEVFVAEGRLRYRAPVGALTEDLRAAAAAHRAELLALLTAPIPVLSWDDLPADWRLAFEECAAIMEYDGGLPRERAEVMALKIILEEMRQHGLS